LFVGPIAAVCNATSIINAFWRPQRHVWLYRSIGLLPNRRVIARRSTPHRLAESRRWSGISSPRWPSWSCASRTSTRSSLQSQVSPVSHRRTGADHGRFG